MPRWVVAVLFVVSAGSGWAQGQRLEQKIEPDAVSAKVKVNRVGATREEAKREEPEKPKSTTQVEEPKPEKQKKSFREIWWEIRRKNKAVY